MNTEIPTRGRKLSALDLCIDHVRFAQATELARVGRYLEAEALLSPKGQIPDSARDLDLLARIAVLQKQFPRAEQFWQAAHEKSPDVEEYSECLEKVRNLDFNFNFDQKEDSDLTMTMLVCMGWIVALSGFATIIWVFWPKK